MFKSWQTSLGGVVQFLVVAWGEVSLLFDGDAMTNPNYNLLVASLVTLLALLKARDNGVSSEAAGAS